MKLTNILNQVICENISLEGKYVTSFVYDGFLIYLFATFHQWSERMGSNSLEEIVDMYEYNFSNNPKYYNRIGVPNKLISEIFTNNFKVIKSEMMKSKLEKSNNRVFFVKNLDEFLDLPDYMDHAEFILATDDFKNYNIITSAFSNRGNYLKSFNKQQDILKVEL